MKEYEKEKKKKKNHTYTALFRPRMLRVSAFRARSVPRSARARDETASGRLAGDVVGPLAPRIPPGAREPRRRPERVRETRRGGGEARVARQTAVRARRRGVGIRAGIITITIITIAAVAATTTVLADAAPRACPVTRRAHLGHGSGLGVAQRRTAWRFCRGDPRSVLDEIARRRRAQDHRMVDLNLRDARD
jgi:hypothetical protein